MVYPLGVTTLLFTAVTAAVSFGLSILASVLNRQKKPPFRMDNKPTPIAERGQFVPRVIGRRRVTHTFAWVGKRRANHHTQGGGGKSLSGGGDGTETVTYAERGFHLLAVGPGTKLWGVYAGGKQIWPKKGGSPITPADTPSGSVLECRGTHGKFAIYWGEKDQPVNTLLASMITRNARSSWPNMMYAFWRPKNLGPQPTWQQLEYDVEIGLSQGQVLQESAMLLSTGVNAAHLLWEVLTAQFPHGFAFPAAELDAAAFEAFGSRCEADGLGMNVYWADGTTGEDAVAAMMQDAGFFLPQVSTYLAPRMIRSDQPNVPVPVITADALVDPDPVVEQLHGDLHPDRLVGVISDRANDFASVDIGHDDDGQRRDSFRVQVKRVDLTTITDQPLAWQVTGRLKKTELANQTAYTLQCDRDARLLVPGDRVDVTGLPRLRVVDVAPAFDTTKVQVSLVVDSYGGGVGTAAPPANSPPGADSGDAVVDVYFKPILLPPDMRTSAGGAPQVIVPRVRGSPAVTGAAVWGSVGGGAYAVLGQQDQYAAGGTLNAPLLCDAAPVVAQGPTITSYNDDVEEVEDLTSNPTAWQNGHQLAVIDDEVVFLQRVTATPGGWRLDGIVRARYGTVATNHAPGAKVIIFTREGVTPLAGATVAAGTTLSVKTQPHTDSDTVDLSEVTAVTGGTT